MNSTPSNLLTEEIFDNMGTMSVPSRILCLTFKVLQMGVFGFWQKGTSAKSVAMAMELWVLFSHFFNYHGEQWAKSWILNTINFLPVIPCRNILFFFLGYLGYFALHFVRMEIVRKENMEYKIVCSALTSNYNLMTPCTQWIQTIFGTYLYLLCWWTQFAANQICLFKDQHSPWNCRDCVDFN